MPPDEEYCLGFRNAFVGEKRDEREPGRHLTCGWLACSSGPAFFQREDPVLELVLTRSRHG